MERPDSGIWTVPPVGWIAVCLWGVAVGSGFTLLTGYRNARGVPAQPPADGATLLVFVHLRCPCTDATMEEDGTTECIGGVCLR